MQLIFIGSMAVRFGVRRLDAAFQTDESGSEVSTIGLRGWVKEVLLKDSSVLFIPFAYANGTDFRPDANTDLTK